MPKLSTIYVNYVDVFMREFPVCDVGLGLIGDPLILSKGNPAVRQCYYTKKMNKCISHTKILGCSISFVF